jgi:hypothetical protein
VLQGKGRQGELRRTCLRRRRNSLGSSHTPAACRRIGCMPGHRTAAVGNLRMRPAPQGNQDSAHSHSRYSVALWPTGCTKELGYGCVSTACRGCSSGMDLFSNWSRRSRRWLWHSGPWSRWIWRWQGRSTVFGRGRRWRHLRRLRCLYRWLPIRLLLWIGAIVGCPGCRVVSLRAGNKRCSLRRRPQDSS